MKDRRTRPQMCLEPIVGGLHFAPAPRTIRFHRVHSLSSQCTRRAFSRASRPCSTWFRSNQLMPRMRACSRWEIPCATRASRSARPSCHRPVACRADLAGPLAEITQAYGGSALTGTARYAESALLTPTIGTTHVSHDKPPCLRPAPLVRQGVPYTETKPPKHLSPAAASPITERRRGKGLLRRGATRSTSARGAMQCRRARVQRSVRNGATELSGAGAMRGVHGRRCGLRIWR